MKSFTAINTAAARVLRQVLIALTVMFAAGAIGIGLAPGRIGNTSSMTILPTRSGISARLDQHERHPSGLLSTIYARLDQHERHPSGLSQIRP